jgi:hypothetical protein
MASMKTTIDIADTLLREAKRLAAKEGVTLKVVVERGLRQVVARKERHSPFRLRKASFKGKGLQPGVKDTSWERVRDLVYEGRGT